MRPLSDKPCSRLTDNKEQSWADDLESLGYIFVYFARGSLPWQGLKTATRKKKDCLVGEAKESLSGDKLCEGFLPSAFATYINYTRSLGFEDKPNYEYLRGLFRRVFRVQGFIYDNVFDWTEKRFEEIHSHANLHAPPREQRHGALECEMNDITSG